ncbi:MAG: serine hydrolase [Anaerolineae bacterium]
MYIIRPIIILLLLVSFSRNSQAQDSALTLDYTDCDFATGEEAAGLSLGAVVIDFNSGRGCIQNAETVYNTASVPKIFIAAAYYDAVINRTIDATGRLQFTRNYWMGGSNDCLTEREIGNSYRYNELVELMINCSDNSATWMLMDSLGWQRVNTYVQSLGIADIGEIIPYAEVDRLKLTFSDERWTDVPAGLASRFYRARMTNGLEEYFSEIPSRPNREQFIEINQRYFDEYNYNTITPYAMGQFIYRLRGYLLDGTPEQWFVATNVFNVMLYTQRLYSAQALPGDIYVASKNGFDRGLLAEINILFDNLQARVPSAMVLMFGQYESLGRTDNSADLPNRFGDRLIDTFFALSPQIRDELYPNYTQPQVQNSFVLSTVVLNDQTSIATCWGPFFASGFDPAIVPTMENCFNQIRPRISYPVDQNLAMGLILRNLNFADTRLTFLYTAPDNRQFSYQIDRQNVTSSGIYWFHPVDMVGQWQVDIYINLLHAYSESILAQR